MDRRVKERLVGASILTVLIVLVVPELLSGPVPVPTTSRLPARTPEPVRNVTVDLATSKPPEPSPLDAHAASGAVASGAMSSSAAPSNGPPTAAASSSAASSMPAPTASAPAASAVSTPLEIAPSLPTSSRHTWAVQLGSFVSRDNADKLARQLRAQGFAVYVLPGGSGPLLRYRVRIGPMPDRSAATQTMAKLKSLGQVASLVSPGP